MCVGVGEGLVHTMSFTAFNILNLVLLILINLKQYSRTFRITKTEIHSDK